jgi:hypothetical protein
VLSGKYFPRNPSFIAPTDGVRRRQIRTIRWARQQSPVKLRRSWETYIRWPLYSCVSIRGTNLAQTWQYSNVGRVSNALKPTFSTALSSLVVISGFERMSWSRHSSFRELTAVQWHPKRGLSLTSLYTLLKRTAYRLTVLTSTDWPP